MRFRRPRSVGREADPPQGSTLSVDILPGEPTTATIEDTVTELTAEEALALLDRQTRKYLELPVETFIARWDAGEFTDSDDPHVRRLAVLSPLGRSHPA